MNGKEMTELLIDSCKNNREKYVPWWDADFEDIKYRYSLFKAEEIRGVTECAAECPPEVLTAPAGYSGLTVFHLLIWCGFREAVEEALKRGTDVNLPAGGDLSGVTPLMTACYRGNRQMTELLLKYGADAALRDGRGRNVLHYLAGMRMQDMVNNYSINRESMAQREDIAGLLEGDVNGADEEGVTPVGALLRNGNSNFSCTLTEIFIKKGADIRAVDEDGDSLLIQALKNRHLTAALVLMEDRELIDRPGAQGKTPLHVAVEGYQLEMCIALLEKHADKNAEDENGVTPKEMACGRGEGEWSELFTSGRLKMNTFSRRTSNAFSGCSGDERDRLGPALFLAEKLIREADADDDEEMGYILNMLYSALMNDEKCRVLDMLAKAGINFTMPIYAGGRVECIRDHCLSGNYGVKVIRKFIDMGLDMDAPVLKGRTPANIVASQQARHMLGGQRDTYFEEAAALFSAESAESVDDEGTTALHEAARNGHTDMLRVMLEKGADVNAAQDAPAEAGNTPLHVACMYGRGEVVKLLMKFGADDTLRNVKGETAAHLAVKKRFGRDLKAEERIAVLEPLTHTDLEDGEGRTPLMLLQELELNTRCDVLPVLLEKGADVNRTDNGGNTVLILAAYRQSYKNIVKELVRAGADVNAANKGGSTALHFALKYGDQESARFLIKKGADYNHADNAGVTPAQIAAEKGYDTVLALMTDIG